MNGSDELTLAGLVHDLNNVLQTMVDAADRLGEDPRHAILAAAILRSVERGKNIADSLLSQSHRATQTPFEQILGNAIAFLEDAQLIEGGPAIHFDTEIDPGIRLGGNWTWERVLINLFLNSRRAMPQGGTIHVQARGPQNSASGVIEISVSDEGSGIPPEILGTLFEPHVSGSQSTGLGLHIVDTIVKQHGGAVSARNREVLPGAEFVITLPSAASRAMRA